MFEARYRNAVLLENHGLHHALQKYSPDIKGLIPQKRNHLLRITLVATVAFAIFAIALNANGISLSDFPGKFKELMQTQVGWKMGVIIGSVALLIGGAFGIIYKVTRGKGKFWGDAHYQPVVLNQATIPGKNKYYEEGVMNPPQQLVDLSLIKKGERGVTQAVQRKKCVEHEIISLSATLVSPLMATGSIVYNTLRAAVIPFYILGRMAQEAITGKQAYPKQRFFRLSDIPKQMALSIAWAIQAPFYATAYFFTALYSFIDPMGGRKAGQLVCNAWMNGVDRRESVWTCCALQGYQWEGGGGPDKLGHQAYYWTGCWMPWATVEVDAEGKLEKAYYPKELFEYDIYTQDESGYSVPDLYELPEVNSYRSPKTLPVGYYRYMQNDNRLHIIAHVTKRTGQRIYIERPILQKPKNIDLFLNEIAKTEGQIAESAASLLRAPNNSQPKEGFYSMVHKDGILYYHTWDKDIPVQAQQLLQNERIILGATPDVFNLKAGEYCKVVIKGKNTLLAHIQDEWGDHLYVTKEILKGDNMNDVNAYLKMALKRSQNPQLDLFGCETAKSILHRASIKVQKIEYRQ